jgi:MscS family membrane protein
MNDTTVVAPTAPGWLPLWLDGVWTLLASYPLLLSAVILFAGLLLAVTARALILYWGGRISARTRTTLDEQLFRLLGGVAVVVISYLSLVAAV